MSCTSKRNIRKGHTTELIFRWLQPDFIYKPITGVQATAPVRLDVVNHNITDGNIFVVTGIQGGGSKLNGNPSKSSSYFRANIADVNTIEINSVNGADYPPYVSGGYIQYRPPIDLTGVTALAQMRESVDSSVVLAEFSTGDGSIVIDDLDGVVTITIASSDTEDLIMDKCIFDYKLIFPDNSEKYSELIEITLKEGATE